MFRWFHIPLAQVADLFCYNFAYMCVSPDMYKARAALACYVVCEGDVNHWCEARVLTLPYTLHIIHRLGNELHDTGRWGENWRVMYFHWHSSLRWPHNLGLCISWKPTTSSQWPRWFLSREGARSSLRSIMRARWSCGFLHISRSDIYKDRWVFLFDPNHQGSIYLGICRSDHARTMPPGAIPGALYQSMVIWHHGYPDVRCNHMGSKPPHVCVDTNRTSTSHDVVTNGI